MTDATSKKEQVVTDFGNGAHVIVPKEWLGDLVKIERVCPSVPPLFESLPELGGESVEVFFEVSGEPVLGTDIPQSDLIEGSMNGDVVEFEVEVQDPDRMVAKCIVTVDGDFYRIRTKREAGSDGWENGYLVERAVSGDGWQEEVDGVVEFDPHEDTGMLWHPVGSIDSFAVKRSP